MASATSSAANQTRFQLPPVELPPLSLDQAGTPPPVDPFDEAGLLVPIGNELLVRGLPRDNRGDAKLTMESVITRLTARNQQLCPLVVNGPKLRNHTFPESLDYVFLQIHPDLVQTLDPGVPRPDLLQNWLATLKNPDTLQGLSTELETDLSGLDAIWSPDKEQDKTRNVHYNLVSGVTATQVKTALRGRGIFYQSEWITPAKGNYPARAGFGIIKPAHVTDLLDKPLEFRPPQGQVGVISLPANVTPVVIPTYAFELAIAGCSGFGGAKLYFDRFLRTKYGGESLRSSRLENDNDLYCFVMDSWVSTNNVLNDAWDPDPKNQFRGMFSFSAPQFLYILNHNRLNPNFDPSRNTVTQAQTDSEARRLMHDVAERADLQIQQLHQENSQTRQELRGLRDDISAVNRNFVSLTSLTIAQNSAQQDFMQLMILESQYQAALRDAQFAGMNKEIGQEEVHRLQRDTESKYNLLGQQRARLQKTQDLVNNLQVSLLPSIPAPTRLPEPAPSEDIAMEVSDPSSSSTHPVDLPLPSAAGPVHDTRSSASRQTAPSMPTSNIGVKRPRRNVRLCEVFSNDTPDPNPSLSALELKIPQLMDGRICRGVLSKSSCTVRVSPVTLWYKVFLACIIFSFVVCTCALSVPFKSLALNANGLREPIKLHTIRSSIQTHRPHAFVISETKSRDKVAGRLNLPDYDMFESEGTPLEHNKRGAKWGVIVGIRRDIQVASTLSLPISLKGRAVVLDLILPMNSGTGLSFRFFGLYAPWNPGGEPTPFDFWESLRPLCQDAKSGWAMTGDFNATLTAQEVSSHSLRNPETRGAYSTFLTSVRGRDLWSCIPRRTVSADHTFRNHTGQSIIDRVAVSSSNCSFVSIVASREFIPATDHRLLISTFAIMSSDRRYKATLTPENTLAKRANRRLLRPRRGENDKLHNFASQVDQRIQEERTLVQDVNDDDQFTLNYLRLTAILTEEGEKVFGYPRIRLKPPPSTSPSIYALNRNIHRLNRLIGAIKTNAYQHLLQTAPWVRPLIASIELTSASQEETLLQKARLRRNSLAKERYQEQKLEARRQESEGDRRRISAMLLGGSAKRLQNHSFQGPPTVIVDPSDPDSLLTSPEDVKRGMVTYFSRLYRHPPPPEVEKPWMMSPSVLEASRRVQAGSFQWPRPMSLNDLRQTLRRGNPSPAPGPDRWEKWCIKALSDVALRPILNLINYEILKSHFPDVVKPTSLSLIHKRNSRLLLSNFRGIMCSNFIVNTPAAWLTALLSDFNAKVKILPDFQVATQKGVQGRDLVAFLGGIESWAHRNNSSVYALKRDQQKGFDYLHPSGFYDAIRAYKLPPSIIDFDIAAQSNIPISIRSAYGDTEPIYVSGVTKQGGPLSPLKSTFTTSLGSYWLHDLARSDPDSLVVSSHFATPRSNHTPSDRLSLLITMVEATDDSFLFALSLRALCLFCYRMECFQLSYGWLTSWEKSQLVIINPPRSFTSCSHLLMPTIQQAPPSIPSDIILLQNVPVSKSLEFLRVDINTSLTRFTILRDLIRNFQIPHLYFRLPFTAIRKLVIQCLSSKIRARLAMQPLLPQHAEQLDIELNAKVHGYLGFPFTPNRHLLSLPLAMHGFGFPSFSRLNAGYAISGLLRDLNHRLLAYRVMAQITLADWTCALGFCHSPFRSSPYTATRNLGDRIPIGWRVAQSYIRLLDLDVRHSDQSYLLGADVSIRHLQRSRLPLPFPLSDSDITLLLLDYGIETMGQVGTWSLNTQAASVDQQYSFNLHSDLSPQLKRRTSPLSTLTLNLVATNDVNLILTRETRRSRAEKLIQAVSAMSRLPAPEIPSTLGDCSHLVASDGSMRPASARFHEDRTVISAVAGNTNFAFRHTQKSSSILQGEIFGIVAAALTAPSLPVPNAVTLITDHLNSVRVVHDATLRGSMPQWGDIPARSYYMWLMDILQRRPDISIRHTQAHTTARTPEAVLNRHADLIATRSQNRPSILLDAPIPTFCMEEYVLFSREHGYIEAQIALFIDNLLAKRTLSHLSARLSHRTAIHLYDEIAPPEQPYVRALSAYSAVVQLYTRSAQLPSAMRLFDRRMGLSPRCRYGCGATETEHHLFVICPTFSAYRDEYSANLVVQTSAILEATGLPQVTIEHVLRIAENIHRDSDSWPLRRSHFYLGLMPRISDHNHRPLPTTAHAKLSMCWHSGCIRLAARIWGKIQRDFVFKPD